jgi:hypothetical protein
VNIKIATIGNERVRKLITGSERPVRDRSRDLLRFGQLLLEFIEPQRSMKARDASAVVGAVSGQQRSNLPVWL